MPRLFTILFRPRDTMKRVLSSDERRYVIPIVVLAIASTMLNEMQKRQDLRSIPAVPMAQLGLIVICIVIATVLSMLLVFYGLSWVAVGAGRLLDGTGEPRDVRAAMAWGMAPIVWAIVYRLPASLLFERPQQLRVDSNWILLVVLAFLEITVFAWWLITTSSTLGVAHRFSTLRGFATLLLVLAAPVVLIVAAALTFAMRS